MHELPMITAAAALVHFSMLERLRRIPLDCLEMAMSRHGLSGDAARLNLFRLATWGLERCRDEHVEADDADSIVAAVIVEADMFARAKLVLVPPVTVRLQ